VFCQNITGDDKVRCLRGKSAALIKMGLKFEIAVMFGLIIKIDEPLIVRGSQYVGHIARLVSAFLYHVIYLHAGDLDLGPVFNVAFFSV